MVESIKGLFVMFILIGLFSIAIISVGIGVSNDNKVNSSITNDTEILELYDDLSSSILKSKSDMDTQKDVLEGSSPEEDTDEISITAIFSIGKKIISLPKTFYNLLVKPLQTKLGVSSIVINAFASIILALMIILIWRWIKSGV